jgi:hypothetical protein
MGGGDPLGTRPVRDCCPVDGAEDSRQQPGDDAGGDHRVRRLTKHFLPGDDRQQIEDDRHPQQTERERDQHRVDRMPQQLRLALHRTASSFGIRTSMSASPAGTPAAGRLL